MTPWLNRDGATVHHGDALDVLRELPDSSVDSVVTDPPYALDFMGKYWDRFTPGQFQHWCEEWAVECLRVLKPGGHLLAFGGTRTWHRLAAGIEDAGFEVRDSIAWLYGSGFSKGGLLGNKAGLTWCSCALDDGAFPGGAACLRCGGLDLTFKGFSTTLKPAFEPVVVARKPLQGTVAANVLGWGTGALNVDASRIEGRERTEYGLSSASRSQGVTYGKPSGSADFDSGKGRWPANVVLDEGQAVALDAVTGHLQGGVTVRRNADPTKVQKSVALGDKHPIAGPDVTYGDSGGASRFFYVAKAPRSERPYYWRKSCDCETMKPWQSMRAGTNESESGDGWSSNIGTSGSSTTDVLSPTDTTFTTSTATSSTTASKISDSSPGLSTSESTAGVNFETTFGGSPADTVESSSQSTPRTGISVEKGGRSTDVADPATFDGWSETSVCGNCGAPSRRESHATVKPLALMRWLVKLVTPPGGMVLEPFAGSGTTVEAALLEGFRCLAVEREAEYLPLVEVRVDRAATVLAAAHGDAGGVAPTLFDV